MFETRSKPSARRGAGETGLPPLPWDLEREALDRLRRLDLPGCRESLSRLVQFLESEEPAEERLEAFYLFDVLSRIHHVLSETPGRGPEWTLRRASMMRALAQAPNAQRLRKAFLEQAEALLRPFERGAAAFNPVVERARSFIEENCTRKLSLRQIAEHVSVSRNYLSTLFRKQCGCTITEYIHRVRMRRAELLLLAGGRTISEVAYMVGYQNYRDFYRNFVKYAKSSPKRFRQSLGRSRAPTETVAGAAPADASGSVASRS
jgi:AraC-like DNA-binding protein